MKLKIKNLFMQFFVFTPLTLIQTFMFWGVIAYILTYDEENTVNRMNGFNVIFGLIIMVALAFAISKFITKRKGHVVEDVYWESNFEFEIYFDVSDNVHLKQTKGGWTIYTTGIVFLHFVMIPINFVLQLIANIFVIISLFCKHILSYYGALAYDECKLPIVQKILHFLFNFVIV